LSRKEAISAAFGAAAATYGAGADVQRAVAVRLADRVAALPRPARPRVLEIGCGTGFLTQALRERLGAAAWTVTDLSPAMVEQCRATLGDPADTRFLVMDGERPTFPSASFDLVVSSLAVQWFEDPVPALARLVDLLRPGGHLAFATLAADSFIEWRLAHAELGLEDGMPRYGSAHDIQQVWPPGGRGQVDEERLSWPYPNGRVFLQDLKRIGARLPVPGHRPLPAGALRRVLRAFERPEGVTLTWHIAYGLFRREGVSA